MTTAPTEQQTPKQNIEERLGEAGPTMFFPRMVETIHLNRQRKNHRRQLEYDRAVQAAVLRGEQPPEWSMHDELEGDDDMGDSFSVAGDTNHYHQPPAPQPAPPQQPRSSVADMVKGGLLATAIASGPLGAGLGWWLSQAPQEQQAPAPPQQQEEALQSPSVSPVFFLPS